MRPNEYRKNVTFVDWKKLRKKYSIIIFDIDNTLDIPDKITQYSKELDDFLKYLKSLDYKIYFMSNNQQDRVESFTKYYDFPYLYSARKPFQKNYKKFLNKKSKEKTIFVGDKFVTDIIGGNLFGGYTILVDPLTEEKKYWYTKFMSFIDTVVRKILKFEKGKYYG